MSHNQTDRFHGASTTLTMVGREQLQQELLRLIERQSSQPLVIALTGEGGIGKTLLLNYTLDRVRDRPGLRAAHALIDLYHAPTHNIHGLAEEIFRVLTPPYDGFYDYDAQRKKLRRLQLSETQQESAKQRQLVLDTFVREVAEICRGKRLVLALDTAERILYETAESSTGEPQIAESWAWLTARLPEWRNIVVLVAGRSPATHLFTQLAATGAVRLVSLDVTAFSAQESLSYFDYAAAAAQTKGDSDVARRIADLGEPMRLRAHRIAGGRPILLALLVDYLSMAAPGQLPPALRSDFPDTEIAQAEKDQLRLQLESQLVDRLKMAPEIGDTIVALGRVPKGADDRLLALLLDIPVADAQTRLKRVTSLSFVKVRPADRRVFLHDEMYAILERQLYQSPDDAAAAGKVAEATRDYYRAQLQEVSVELNRLFAPVEDEGSELLDWPALGEAFDRRRSLQTELVYYRLRQDAAAGVRAYCRFMRDSVISGDVPTGVQLHTELLAYLTDLHKLNVLTDSERAVATVIHGLLALRTMERAWTTQDHTFVITEASRVRDAKEREIGPAGAFASTTINIWEAYALTYRGQPGDLHRALELLDASIDYLSPIVKANDSIHDLQAWLAKATLAWGYRVRGYARRISGFVNKAIPDYRIAAPLLREVNLKIEMAYTLNDMGFALAERGYWSDGRALASDALELRRSLGPRGPVALSINTLAIIDMLEGNYQEAIRKAQRALGIFRVLNDQRGSGLALIALSEALRRQSAELLSQQQAENIRLLRDAAERAGEAVDIFRTRNEQPRLIQALIELGCAYRDRARLRAKSPAANDPIEPLISRSKAMLEEAAEKTGVENGGPNRRKKSTGGDMLHNYMDALVDLAWLGYHVGRKEITDDAIRRVEAAIPPKYHFNPKTGKPFVKPDQAQILIWPQIGKLHILKGHRAFDESAYAEAGLNYFWGLQYSTQYAEEYHKLVRAKKEIYDKLRGCNKTELREVLDVVTELERGYNLTREPGSVMRQLMTRRALWSDD